MVTCDTRGAPCESPTLSECYVTTKLVIVSWTTNYIELLGTVFVKDFINFIEDAVRS